MPIVWMAGLAIASWLGVRVATGGAFEPEVLLGMLAPLVSAVLTWIAVSWAHAVAPTRVTSVLIWGFALKFVGFGVYVVTMLKPLALRPVPFIVSFAGAFITLHAVEAVFLRRMMGNAPA